MSGTNGPDHGARCAQRDIRRAVEASLKRLRTDRIDLYQLHFPRPDHPARRPSPTSSFVTLWPGIAQRRGLPLHVYFETAPVVIALLLMMRWLELRAKKRAADSMKALVGLTPRPTRVLRRATELDVPVDDVRVGDLVRIRPGEGMPMPLPLVRTQACPLVPLSGPIPRFQPGRRTLLRATRLPSRRYRPRTHLGRPRERARAPRRYRRKSAP